MKIIRFFVSAIVILAVGMSMQNIVKADMNAQGIVDQFNSASGGTRMQFNYGYNYEVTMTQVNGMGFADTSAYAQGVTGGSNYFTTFCMEPSVGVSTQMSAQLSYAGNTSTTETGRNSLTIGAAYLYSQFAAGTLSGYTYTNTSARTTSNSNLTTALRYLIGVYTADWSNPFMKYLLTVNEDKNFWLQSYNPNQYYDVIGNYSVFVMNNSIGTNTPRQNFLYVTTAINTTDGPSGTPEPGTVLLWGLGCLGAFRVASKRRFRVNQSLSEIAIISYE